MEHVPPSRPPVPCEQVRDLVSAGVDDELTRDERDVVQHHLAECDTCARYAEQLTTLTRQVRLRAAPAVPDLAARVIDRARPPRLGRGGWLRPALAWVALVLAAQSVSPLLLGEADGASTHVARHLGAFSLALAIGLAYAAWRPHRAFGLLPFAAALVVTMAGAATLDVISGVSSATAEVVHVTELVGLVMLWMISGSPGLGRLRFTPRGGLLRASRG